MSPSFKPLVAGLVYFLAASYSFSAEVDRLEGDLSLDRFKDASALSEKIIGDVVSIEDILSAEDQKGIKFSLADCIYIALRDNEAVESGYLSRITQRLSLEDAENNFLPSGSITAGINRTDSDTRAPGGSHESAYTFTGANLTLGKRFRSGGNLAYTLSNLYTITDNGELSAATTNWSLTFTQPLLRGAGFDIGSLPLTRAYLSEKQNILSLRSTVISTVNTIIGLYRDYITQIVDFEIEQAAIERARKDFERVKILVELGREPKTKLVDQEIFLAEREIDWETERNSKDEARIALLRAMNIDTTIPLIPDRLDYYEIRDEDLPTLEEALAIAHVYDEAYIGALISLRQAELNLMEAKNNQLYNLDLTARINNANNGSNVGASSYDRAYPEAYDQDKVAWSVGLNFSADLPINRNSTRLTPIINAKIAMRNAKIAIRQADQQLIQSLTNTLRNLKSLRKQVGFETVRLEQRELQLAQDRIRFDAGEITTFEYNGRQVDLIAAQRALLGRKIAYLNALRNFDDQLGTTLETWQIDLDNRLVKKPELLKNYYQKEMAKVKSY